MNTKHNKFVVTLRGEHVFQECQIIGYVSDKSDESIEKIKYVVKQNYKLNVSDFTTRFGVLYAITDNPKVKVFIESVDSLD